VTPLFLTRLSVLGAVALIAATPYSPDYFFNMAKTRTMVPEKTGFLKRLLKVFPESDTSRTAREHLVALLAGSNRFDEALVEYRNAHPAALSSAEITDFKLLDFLLKTGHFNEVLRQTEASLGSGRFTRDLRLMELRVQAWLAQGEFMQARAEADRWYARYKNDGQPGTLYASDVQSAAFLVRHLRSLERIDGAKGKPLFTASVSDSMNRWSRRQQVPITFFKLIPARSGGQRPERLLAGRYESDRFFQERVDEMNRGFDYLSSGRFSLQYQGQETLYVRSGELDPTVEGGRSITSRVYVHTLPQIYRLAGDGFVVLVDYRERAADQAAYMGDGIVHISAQKLQTLILMHEVLHGLGATHQDWNYLERQGYRFDPDDRGLMTFEDGEIKYLGLEAKNRAILDWPAVAVVRLSDHTQVALNHTDSQATLVSSR